jgi:zinc protease
MKRGYLALAGLLLALAPTYPVAAEQAAPPPPAPPRKAAFASAKEKTLDNGLEVIIIERRGLPLISAALFVKNGAEADPAGLAGVANMTASLLTKGTESRTAPQIAQEIETLGASLESGAEWDYSYIKLVVLSTQSRPALEIAADLVRHPMFKDGEIDRLRKQTLDELRVELDEPGKIAGWATGKLVFGDTAYGHPSTGTLETVGRMSRDEIVKLHRTYYRPDNSVLAICGDITAEQGFQLAQQLFGDWAKPAEKLPPISVEASTLPSRRTVVIDMPDAGQAAVMLAKQCIERTSEDYFKGEVTNAVLGMGYSSRLNEEIRVKRGLSYGAGSGLDARRRAGRFAASAQTKNESAPEVASLMKKELAKLGHEPVGKDELVTRKASLTGEFARKLETNVGFASEVAKLAARGIPPDALNSYLDRIEQVGADGVQSFARKYLQPDETSMVIVGNLKLFRHPLLESFKDAVVIKKDDLDLTSLSLRRGNGER